MSKIVILGYYGYGNFGDDLMLYNIGEYLSKKHSLDIITFNKKNTKIINKSNVTVHETFKDDKFKNFRLLYSIFKGKNYLLWGGGTCFSDEDGVVSPVIMLMAKLMKLKIIFIGVGVNEIKNPKNKIKMIINSKLINKMFLRDEQSYENISKYFKRKKLEVTEDLAHLYDLNIIGNDKKNVITVSLRNLDNYISKESESVFVDNLVNFLKNILENDRCTKLNILALDSVLDVEINERLYEILKREVGKNIECNLVIHSDFQKKLEFIQQSKLMICVRLHGVFISELSGIKTIGIGYSQKIENFMKTIGSNGYISLCDAINEPKILEEKYKEIFKNRKPVNINSLRTKALKNFEFLS